MWVIKNIPNNIFRNKQGFLLSIYLIPLFFKFEMISSEGHNNQPLCVTPKHQPLIRFLLKSSQLRLETSQNGRSFYRRQPSQSQKRFGKRRSLSDLDRPRQGRCIWEALIECSGGSQGNDVCSSTRGHGV